ncbi:hypothetical protein EJ06DRAFT_515697 [Trichodelitschia bisporula]|uniref:magnesium chelatase n=1 Tax=Trichodelitschia bisporula TaxID=703511 RepID=A0A6G1HLW5_9PEZI|nr:hypothetical protein EJ06DRAFT_515697 [Trichodelitschia bisporula]
MGGESDALADKAQELSDIELAVLLCLVTGEHCIIEADEEELDNVERELQLICAGTFELQCAVVDFSENTTVDEFSSAIFADDYVLSPVYDTRKEELLFPPAVTSIRRPSLSQRWSGLSRPPKIANVIVGKHLNLAQQQVQVQVLELMRSKHNRMNDISYAAPEHFLFIALLSTAQMRRPVPRNDHFFISHIHSVEDGLTNLELRADVQSPFDDSASMSSIIRSPPPTPSARSRRTSFKQMPFSGTDIDTLKRLAAEARLSPDVRAYLHNIVVFARTHRVVAWGISAQATRHLYALSRALAPLHGLDYIPPSLVALAARKVYPHRILIVKPEDEKSVQWGSSVQAVAALLEGLTPKDVVEEILSSVEPPL